MIQGCGQIAPIAQSPLIVRRRATTPRNLHLDLADSQLRDCILILAGLCPGLEHSTIRSSFPAAVECSVPRARAGHCVTKLPKADQAKPHWQTAAHELMTGCLRTAVAGPISFRLKSGALNRTPWPGGWIVYADDIPRLQWARLAYFAVSLQPLSRRHSRHVVRYAARHGYTADTARPLHRAWTSPSAISPRR